jgi:hypothetical protein
MTQTHNTDPIIDEIHRTRREIFDKFGGDMAAILDDARKRQAASGRPVWRGKSSNNESPPNNGEPTDVSSGATRA